MKKIILLWLIILIGFSGFTQNQDWEVYIGYPGKWDYPETLLEANDKGYFVGAQSGLSGWLIKTDINADPLYSFLNTDLDMRYGIWAIAQDSSGNTYLGGCILLNQYNNFMPFVAKLNPCGESLWCRSLINPDAIGGGSVWDLLINKDNEIIALINYGCADYCDQIFLAVFSEAGNLLWKKAYASPSQHQFIINMFGWDLLELNDKYYIAGECYYPFPNNPNHVYLRALFIGIDSNFNEKWILPFYKLDYVFGWAETVIPLNDSVLMGAGIRRCEENGNSLLMFFNIDGEELGYKQITNGQIGPDINANYITNIEKVNDTIFLAASPFGPDDGVNPIGELIIDTTANLYNFQSRPNTEKKPSLVKTFDNNFVIATDIKTSPTNRDIYLYKIDGNLESVPFDINQYVYDSLCPHAIQSGTLDFTDCLMILNTDEIPLPEQYYESIRWIPVKVFPNPVKEGKVSFEFENTAHHRNMEMRIYNIMGREVTRQMIYRHKQTTEIDVEGWSSGIYLAVVFSNGGAMGRTKFVVEKEE